MASKFAMYDQIFGNHLQYVEEPMTIWIAELILLQWPSKMVSRCMFTIGRTVRTGFACLFREVARGLRKAKFDQFEKTKAGNFMIPSDIYAECLNIVNCSMEYLKNECFINEGSSEINRTFLQI